MDIIRIFSCICVFAYHLGIMKGGYLAVCTFFCDQRIFLFPVTLEKRWRSEGILSFQIQKENVTMIDTSLLEQGDHFMPDRIHLNEKGNALLAEKIISIFR